MVKDFFLLKNRILLFVQEMAVHDYYVWVIFGWEFGELR